MIRGLVLEVFVCLLSMSVAQVPPVGIQCNIDSASECLANITDSEMVINFVRQGFSGELTNVSRLCSEVTEDVVRCFQVKSVGCRKDTTLPWESLYATLTFLCGNGKQGYEQHYQCLNTIDVVESTNTCVQNMTVGVNQVLGGPLTPEQQFARYCGLIEESRSCLQLAVSSHCIPDAAIYMGDLTDASYLPLTEFLQCPRPTQPAVSAVTESSLTEGPTANNSSCDIIAAANCMANVTDSSIMFGFAEGKSIITHIPNITQVCRALTADVGNCMANTINGCPKQESLGLEVTYASLYFLCRTGKEGYHMHQTCFAQPDTKGADRKCAEDMGKKVRELIMIGDPLGSNSGDFCKIISEGRECLRQSAATFCNTNAARYIDMLTVATFKPLTDFLSCPVSEVMTTPTATARPTTEPITPVITTEVPTSSTTTSQSTTTTSTTTVPTISTTTPTTTSTTTTQTVVSCSGNQFRCGNGRCIPVQWQCDGASDCADQSDEFRCAPRTCRGNEFTCGSNECIPGPWRCDGDNDCSDFSDEFNCTNSQPNATTTPVTSTSSTTTVTTASTTTPPQTSTSKTETTTDPMITATPQQTSTSQTDTTFDPSTSTASSPVPTTTLPITSPTTSPLMTSTVMVTSSTTANIPTTLDPECQRCHARGVWKNDRFMQAWCGYNCRNGFCPPAMCYCGCPAPDPVFVCQAVGSFRGTMGINDWCAANCRNGDFCPTSICRCRFVVLSQ